MGLLGLSGCGQGGHGVGSGEDIGGDDVRLDVTFSAAAEDVTAEQDVPAEEDVTAEEDSSSVVLGQAQLTAGIPGDGPLTIEQINEWFGRPENHVVLNVQLPLGLAAGQGQMQGLEENPLTRAKIELGRQLYFDRRLSVDNTVSCADCHHPDEGYTRGTQFGVGINGLTGDRNSPVSYNRILSGAQFWDGRAASLEEQAKGPIANPIEMGNTHEKAVDTIKNIQGYRLEFAKVFPDEGVTIDTIAKAIAAFERAIVTGPSPYDYFEVVRAVQRQYDQDELEGLEQDDPELYARYSEALSGSQSMSESARRGRELFFSDRVGCTACHVGANFADEKYHNLGIGMDRSPDQHVGRFNLTNDEKDRGAFKTPTLRNVEFSAPYMHDGSVKTLMEAVEWYDKGGHPNPHLSDKIKKLNLTDQEKQDLVEFMKSLSGPFPEVQSGRLPQ
jgi:cytochrome c peroxidase